MEAKALSIYYILDKNGTPPHVKEGEFFKSNGGLTEAWGKPWVPIEAGSIADARRKAAAQFGVVLPSWYARHDFDKPAPEAAP